MTACVSSTGQKKQRHDGKHPHTPPGGGEDGVEWPGTLSHRGGDAATSITTPGDGCMLLL